MKNTSLAILFIFTTFALGCAGLDSALSTRGVISVDISKFDKSKVVRMTPSLTNHGGAYPEFGLYWHDDLKEKAFLVARLTSTVNFSRAGQLDLIIDGEKFSLPPVRKSDYGDIEYDSSIRTNISEKNFIITKDQILKIANGKEGGFRLSLLKDYIDGDINYDYQEYQTYLPKPFREFYKTVWGNKS